MWSIGIIAYILCTGSHPFEDFIHEEKSDQQKRKTEIETSQRIISWQKKVLKNIQKSTKLEQSYIEESTMFEEDSLNETSYVEHDQMRNKDED